MGEHDGTENSKGEAAHARTADLSQKSSYAAMCMLWNVDKGYAFQACLRLKIPDILAKAEGEGKPGLSAEEIVERLPARRSPGGAETATRLKTLLEPLLQDGMFARSVVHGDRVIYSSTDISRSFAENNKSNILGITDFVFSEPIRKAYESLEHALLDDSNKSPFEIVHGTSMYEYGTKNSEFGTSFKGLMTGFNKFQVLQLLETLQQSGVLRGVKTLVDVGGGVGTFLAGIISKNPHIRGINFDQPHVVNLPVAAKGVEQVGGNFFDSVPSGDVMILKTVLHNYSDEEAIHILRNCHEALPQNGKVLIVEYVLPEVEERYADLDFKNIQAVATDLAMLALFRAGRERCMREYDAMIAAAGFSSPTVITTPHGVAIIQASKSQHSNHT